MKIGDKVRITKCDVCPKVIGKVVTIVNLETEDEDKHCLDVVSVDVKFGRGRPRKDRPTTYVINDVCLSEEI